MFVFYLSSNLLALTRHHPLPAAKATWDMGDGARDCHTSPHSSQMNRVSAETPHSQNTAIQFGRSSLNTGLVYKDGHTDSFDLGLLSIILRLDRRYFLMYEKPNRLANSMVFEPSHFVTDIYCESD